MTIPARSIQTSTALPFLPSTRLWWYSSTIAYSSEIAAAAGSGLRVSGRSVHHHSSASAPNTTACASLRRTRSAAPSPESRSGCEDSQKISAISTSGTGARLAALAIGLTAHIVLV
jgi:hypothetical protein